MPLRSWSSRQLAQFNESESTFPNTSVVKARAEAIAKKAANAAAERAAEEAFARINREWKKSDFMKELDELMRKAAALPGVDERRITREARKAYNGVRRGGAAGKRLTLPGFKGKDKRSLALRWDKKGKVLNLFVIRCHKGP